MRHESQVVRDGRGRDHEIVRTDWCAQTLELLPNPSIGLGAGIVEGQRRKGLEEIVKDSEILGGSAAFARAIDELGLDDRGEEPLGRSLRLKPRYWL